MYSSEGVRRSRLQSRYFRVFFANPDSPATRRYYNDINIYLHSQNARNPEVL